MRLHSRCAVKGSQMHRATCELRHSLKELYAANEFGTESQLVCVKEEEGACRAGTCLQSFRDYPHVFFLDEQCTFLCSAPAMSLPGDWTMA